jgi:hypothetical protein
MPRRGAEVGLHALVRRLERAVALAKVALEPMHPLDGALELDLRAHARLDDRESRAAS